MFYEEQTIGRRWARIGLVAIPLMLCILALGGFTVVAQGPIFPQAVLESPTASRHDGATALLPHQQPVEPRARLGHETLQGQKPRSAGLAQSGGMPFSTAANVVLAPPLPEAADLAVCQSSKRVWGLAGPGETVTVTVDGTQMGAALADGNGFFWTTLYDGNGDRPGLSGGETVAIYHDGVLLDSTNLRTIAGSFDVVTDLVSGTIGGLSSPISVTVYVGSIEPSLVSYSQTVSSNGSGNFVADFTGILDLVYWDSVQVAYVEDDIEVHRHVYADSNLLVLPLPFNSVEGTAPPGSVVTATVYDTGMVVTASTTLDADATTGNFRWGVPVDLLPDYVVEVKLQGGQVLSRTIDTLSLSLDPANDQITGISEPNSTVRGTVSDLGEHGWRDVRIATTADGNGAYTLDFSGVANLLPGRWAGVFVADAEGDDLSLWTPSPSVDVHQTWNEISGIGTSVLGSEAEGRVVTLTLASTTTIYTTDMGWWGGYVFEQEKYGLPDIVPGEVVTVEAQGYPWQGVVEVKTMTVTHDVGSDQFDGSVEPPSDRVEIYGWQWGNWIDGTPLYPVGGSFDTLTTTASSFSTAPAGFDVRNAVEYDVAHRTADEYLEMIYNQVDYVRIWPQYNGLFGQFGPPGTTYTITLRAGDDTFKDETTGTSTEPVGWSNWIGFQNAQMESGDQVQAQSSAGFSQTVHIPTITTDADDVANVISGTAPTNALLYVSVNGQDTGFVPTDGGGQFAVAVDQLQYAPNGDLASGDWVMVCYFNEDNNQVCVDHYWPMVRMDVNYGHDWAEVETIPGSTVTVTVAGKGMVVGQAGMDGWFRTYDWPWDPERPDFEPGDVVTATAIGLEAAVNPIGSIGGMVDADADTVSGLISAPFPTVTVQCEVWIEGGGPTIVITDVNGSGGSYLCDYGAVGWDILPGQSYAVRYFEPDGDTVINVFEPPWMRVNYGDNWVGATYPAGHTFWITVTDDVGTPKGYAQIDSVSGGGWGGDGFETREEDWLTGRPDIQPWDWVYARADDGYTHSIQVGDITGDVDVDENTISGTITADFTQTLYVRCEVWVENGPDGIDTTAEPDGGSYFCDFDDVGWDLLPGQTVSVRYHEPDDNDAVINTFREPAPNMYIEKWVEGSGQVAPGGPVVFGLRYRNHGSVAATTVYLTDTLPANTTYVTDTSGFPATIVGDQVVWTFGPVASQQEARFQLVLDNTATEGDTLVNQADIWTLYDEDPNNNHAEAQAQVVGAGEQPDVWVNKNPNPGDPAPGQTMVWELNYGNNGPVPSGQVTLTDTIPDGTSIVSWFSDNGYHLWTEHSTAAQFILEAPSIPGQWGDRIYLRLRLDAGLEAGTQLTNTVEITTTNDGDPGNNWHQRNDVWTGNERWNGNMDKNMDWGELVPGGYVVYDLNVHNNGNMAAHTWLTDTLPAGTSFVESWIWTGGGEQPFPPTSVDATTVVWDLGEMQPADWYNIGVRLAIDAGLDSGTFFTNCAEITIDGPDNWPYDNAKCAVERLNEPGTNLRVNKDYQWEGDGVIRYDIYLQNLGTTTLQPVWVTDAYPDGLSFNGDWWVGHGPWITMTHDAQNRELTFWYQQLDPGGSSRVYYRLDMDEPGAQGLCFTNAAESPQPGDVWTADNYADVTACTGPDVYAEKWLSGGEPKVGELLTFTVEFGNRNHWPWNGNDQVGSHITETLPAGMTFITATAPWDPNQPWYPERIDGNTIVWGFGTLWADNWWQFDVVAQITGPVQDGDVLVNTVEAWGDSPNDIEPDEANNVFELPLTIQAPDFQVDKSYEGSAVAGTSVTYTLVVTNVGAETGTNVVLSDTLPAGLTYGGGDGTFDGTDVTWSLGTVAANGGTASGWFSATLACAGAVSNEDYGVASSDQGVTSLDGDPVSLTIIAPTLTPAFEQSATEVDPGQTVTFSDTSTTNGSAIVAWSWDFGDGGSASGATASHAYNAPDSYDVTLTITDACGYSDSVTVVDAVTIAQYRIYLPLVVRQYTP
jgi:uncharacterized repeat protein (TIGR01451 family)